MAQVDCGNARAGVWWEDETILELATFVHQQPNTTLQGLYTHCGHSYAADTVEKVKTVRDDTIQMMNMYRILTGEG